MRHPIQLISYTTVLLLGVKSVIGLLSLKPIIHRPQHSSGVKSEPLIENSVQSDCRRRRSDLVMSYDDECVVSQSAMTPPYCTEREYLKNATVEMLAKPSPLTPAEFSEINHIIKGWANKQKNGAVYVERLIKKIVDERALSGSSTANELLTTELYNNLICSWVPSWSEGEMTEECAVAAAERAESILKYMQSQYEAGHDEIKPNIKSFNSCIRAWYNSGSSIAPVRAGMLLKWAYSLYMTGTNGNDFIPSFHSFSRVIELYAFRNYATSFNTTLLCAQRAEEILEFMEDLAYNGNELNPKYRHLRPNVDLYNACISAYARCSSMSSDGRDVAKRAERLLHRMIYLRKHFQRQDLYPTVLSYNAVINCWSKSGDKSAAKRAETILNYLEDSNNLLNPDEYSYSTVIDAWAKQSGRDPKAAEKAEAILTRMENNPDVVPNTISYNAVLNSYAKSTSPEAPVRAEALLRRMQFFASKGINREAKPDRISYNTVIMAWAKSNEVGAAQSAENLLIELEALYRKGHTEMSPTVFTYNTVIEAWTRSNNPNAVRGEQVLERLIEVSKERGLVLDSYGFNSLIHAYAKTGTHASAVKTQELLKTMDDLSKFGNNKVRPDLYTYTTIMDAICKSDSPDAAEKVEALFLEMLDKVRDGDYNLRPNTLCYNILLGVYRKSGCKESALKAEEWLNRMEMDFKSGNESAKPDVYSYNHVISAWTYSGAEDSAKRAESLLKRMENIGVKINSFSYNGVINAWSKSKRPRKAQKALSILRGMDALYKAGNKDIRPNAYSYTTLLNACAFSCPEDDKLRARILDIALAALQELQGSKYGSPNHVTYGTFLKVCANLLDDEDDDLKKLIVEPVFHRACEDGQVGQLVLNQLRDAAPAELYASILSEIGNKSGDISLTDLPSEWTRNVKERRSLTPRRRLKHRAALPNRTRKTRQR